MQKLTEALCVTAEICGTEFSLPASKAIVSKLMQYPEADVLRALDRCQTEVKGRLSLAAIIERIDNGWPSADEAWSIALSAMDEARTVITNQEIANAYGIAKEIHDQGDEVGARMAFRAAYDRIIANKRNQPPTWYASIGFDKQEAEAVITDAVDRGLLSHSYATKVLPYKPDEKTANNLLTLGSAIAKLENKSSTEDEKASARRHIDAIKRML